MRKSKVKLPKDWDERMEFVVKHAKETGELICPYCGQEIDKIVAIYSDIVAVTWDKVKRSFSKSSGTDSDKPYAEPCGCVGWEFFDLVEDLGSDLYSIAE